MVLQASSNFFARSVHGQRSDIGAQADRQVPALAGFKSASLLFEPPLELGAGHALTIQQICCLFNAGQVVHPLLPQLRILERLRLCRNPVADVGVEALATRSEEHTSEL